MLFESERIRLFSQIYKIFQIDYLEHCLECANNLALSFIRSFMCGDIYRQTYSHARDNLVQASIGYLTDNINKFFTSQDIVDKHNNWTSHLFRLIKKACESIKYIYMRAKSAIDWAFRIRFAGYFALVQKECGNVAKRVKIIWQVTLPADLKSVPTIRLMNNAS